MTSKIYKLLSAIYYADQTPESLKILVLKFVKSYSKIRYKNKKKYLFPWSDFGKKSLIGSPLFTINQNAYFTQYYSESTLPNKLTIENSDLFKYEIYKARMLKRNSDISLNFLEDSLLPISILDNKVIHEISLIILIIF